MTEQCKQPCSFELLKEGGGHHFVGNLFCVLDAGHTTIHKYIAGHED